jgi:ParB-like chromosome segregation protein Spo0J
VHRSSLKNAPYNPRTISEENKAWLRQKLKTRGLLQALVWNEKSGNLVGGHQRLAALDALEGHGNYLIGVNVVQLDHAAEVEENIALNSGRTGDWDLDLLAQVLKTPDLELEATGFTFADIQVNFEDPDLATLFAPNESSAKALDEVTKQQEAANTKKRLQKDREQRSEAHERDQDTENYAVVMFKSRGEREAFVALLGYGTDERYVDGPSLHTRLEAGRPDKPVTEPRASSPKPKGKVG